MAERIRINDRNYRSTMVDTEASKTAAAEYVQAYRQQNTEREVKISVIMGIYNPRDNRQLPAAILSIINQTMTDWELILCDDGSHVSHQPLIREAIGMDDRIIRIRNKTNQGLGYSLNQCLRIAKGKYIARMDGDDISEPDRFEKEYDFLEKHAEYQWVGSNALLFDESGVWGEDKMPETPEAEDFLAYSPYIHPSVMFRAEVLHKIKGYPISEETRRCEDYELFMRLYRAGFRGYNIQEALLRYREDEYTYKKRTLQSRIQEMKIRYRGFRSLGLLRPETVAYVVKPLAAGAVPPSLLHVLRHNTRRGEHVSESEEPLQAIPKMVK